MRYTSGNLSRINAIYPHHLGNIEFNLTKKGTGVVGEIALPSDMKGDFIWGSEKLSLKAGKQKINL